MLRNWYLEELKNDLDFRQQLAEHPDCYRIFLPFLQDNNYISEEDFAQDLMYEEGLEDWDIDLLCHKAGISKPYWQPCRVKYWEEEMQEEENFEKQDREHDRENLKKIPDWIRFHFEAPVPMRRYCIGIGHYKTKTEGEFQMCVLIDLYDRSIGALSFATKFHADMTEPAIHFAKEAALPHDILIHSSQNPVYRNKRYKEICRQNHVVMSMTEPGTRGGIMPVSRFFSTLKREMKGYIFYDVQDGIDWLSAYVLKHNLNCAFIARK